MTNEELVAQVQAGADVSENLGKLYEQNRGLMLRIINEYVSDPDEIEDLMQESFFALFEASNRFDPSRGVKFSSYLGIWVKNTVLRYSLKNSTTLNIPEAKKWQIINLRKMINASLTEYGQAPAEGLIRIEMDIDKNQFDELAKINTQTNCRSLNEIIGHDEDGSISLGDTIADPDDRIEALVDDCAKQELAGLLWDCVAQLKDEQAEIIKSRYKENKTFSQIAENQQCSTTHVVRTHQDALYSLSRGRRGKKLREMYFDVYSISVKPLGIKHFNQTWTSTTELAVFRDMGI